MTKNLYRKKIAKFKKSKCIVAENVTKKILNLPIYPTLKLNQILYIAKSIKNELANARSYDSNSSMFAVEWDRLGAPIMQHQHGLFFLLKYVFLFVPDQ